MNFFNKYVSNTLAGTANQSFFYSDNTPKIGRVYYKPTVLGKFNYSFLFSNTIDSTYADGSHSYKNLILNNWKILSLKAAPSKKVNDTEFTFLSEFKKISFNHIKDFERSEPKLINTEPIELCVNEGEYICLEIEFSGKYIPFHPEVIIPTFVKENDVFVSSTELPLPCAIGIERKVKNKIAFLGDSITQGIGTPIDSYEHYCAIAANEIGEDYAFWNLGIGYARAVDMASDGILLKKAKQNDIVCVCAGVNDIIQGLSEHSIKSSLDSIVLNLKNANCKVLLQTIPPFGYDETKRKIWADVNEHILTKLKDQVDFVFDNRKILGIENSLYMPKYGPHPNSNGCLIFGKELAKAIKTII